MGLQLGAPVGIEYRLLALRSGTIVTVGPYKKGMLIITDRSTQIYAAASEGSTLQSSAAAALRGAANFSN